MPKAPILTRTAIFIPVRGNGTTPGVRDSAGNLPTFRRYEWNIVTTSLGTMLELVSNHLRGNVNGGPAGGMTNEDVFETDYTDIKIMTLDQLAAISAAGVNGGDSLPRDFSKLGLP
jgi:hypothetical protein